MSIIGKFQLKVYTCFSYYNFRLLLCHTQPTHIIDYKNTTDFTRRTAHCLFTPIIYCHSRYRWIDWSKFPMHGSGTFFQRGSNSDIVLFFLLYKGREDPNTTWSGALPARQWNVINTRKKACKCIFPYHTKLSVTYVTLVRCCHGSFRSRNLHITATGNFLPNQFLAKWPSTFSWHRKLKWLISSRIDPTEEIL